MKFIDLFYKDVLALKESVFAQKADLQLNIRNQYLNSKVLIGYALNTKDL